MGGEGCFCESGTCETVAKVAIHFSPHRVKEARSIQLWSSISSSKGIFYLHTFDPQKSRYTSAFLSVATSVCRYAVPCRKQEIRGNVIFGIGAWVHAIKPEMSIFPIPCSIPMPSEPLPSASKNHFNGSAFEDIFLTHIEVLHLHAVFVS